MPCKLSDLAHGRRPAQFFLELWEEINRRANLRTKAEAVPSLPNPSGASEDPHEGTIFEELIRHYQELVERAEDMIVASVTNEVEGELKAHLQSGGSTCVSSRYLLIAFRSVLTCARALCSQATPDISPDSPDDIALAQTLLGPLALLSSHLSFLRATLPRATVTSLYRRIASRLASHLLQRQVLFRGRSLTTLMEAKAVLAEAELWVETCRVALKEERGRVEAPWRPFLQAARLLAAEGDAWAKVVDATFGVASDSEWEDMMLDFVELCEFPREEVQTILRRREDCER